MAFWGIEVKPGKPFTHTSDDARGRLHISQATLGIGTATKKSLVQCNVGNRSPVFLCSLFPYRAETCQLNLEFEEADEVVFSVIGPQSVHLTGYYVGCGRHYTLNNDDSESYGEDIAETETERSTDYSDEDEYKDSFIDDGDLEVFPSSPVSSVEVTKETFDKRVPKNRMGSRRRLRKKYHLSESEDSDSSHQQNFVNGTTGEEVLDSESEDMLPISSLYKSNRGSNDTKLDAEEAEEKADKEIDETSNNKTKDDANCIIISNKKADDAVDSDPKRKPDQCNSKRPSAEVSLKQSAERKRKKKGQPKEGKLLVDDGANCYNDVFEEDKAQQNETEADKMGQNLPLKNERQKTANYKGANLPHFSLLSTEAGTESGVRKAKKKRKEWAKEEKSLEVNGAYHSNVVKEDNTQQDKANIDNICQHLPVKNEQNQKQANDDRGACLPHHSLPPSTQVYPENDAKIKRKRKDQVGEKDIEADSTSFSNVLEEDTAQKQETKADNTCQSLPLKNKQNQKQANDEICNNDANQFTDENQYEEKKKKKKKKKRSKTQENGEAGRA